MILNSIKKRCVADCIYLLDGNTKQITEILYLREISNYIEVKYTYVSHIELMRGLNIPIVTYKSVILIGIKMYNKLKIKHIQEFLKNNFNVTEQIS
jgi:hemoglobin-like flavoprotein